MGCSFHASPIKEVHGERAEMSGCGTRRRTACGFRTAAGTGCGMDAGARRIRCADARTCLGKQGVLAAILSGPPPAQESPEPRPPWADLLVLITIRFLASPMLAAITHAAMYERKLSGI